MKKMVVLAVAMMCTAFPVAAEMREMQDGHIAEVMVAASTIAIEAGKLAQARSANQEVKAYAERMISEHTKVSQSFIELVTKLEVTLQGNPNSQSLRSDGERIQATLLTLGGEQLDKAYIDQKVVFYQNILDTIDNQLIPNASNEELKALLYHLFSPFSLHLEDAQQIQESLSRQDAKS